MLEISPISKLVRYLNEHFLISIFHLRESLNLSQTTNFRLFQTEEFADDNLKFDENRRKLSEREENTVGKGEIARFEQFLFFPQCFQDLPCRHVKTSACLGKG